jgi:SAM-dependent methyltransferase
MYKLKSDLILYRDKISLLASNNLNSFEKLRMISDSEVEIFLSLLEGKTLSESEESLVNDWYIKEPGLFIKEVSEKQKLQNLVKSMKKEALAYQKVKKRDDVISYHQNDIKYTEILFNYNETTLSQMFRDQSAAFNELSFGEALCDKLINFDGSVKSLNILEVGCGTGLVAFNFLNRIKDRSSDIYEKLNYTMFDLSPTMMETQKKQCSVHLDRLQFLSGNIEEHCFSESYDLIIMNEVIADLNVDVGSKAESIPSEAESLVEKYDLDISKFPNKYILNTEAIKLVSRLHRFLKDDGVAFLSEYGSLDEVPIPVELPGHNEYSINFGHLARVWSQKNLKSEYGSVGDLLEFDKDYRVLDEKVRELLVDYLLPFLGVKSIPRRSYSHELLRESIPIEFDNFLYVPFSKLSSKQGTLSPFLFKYILLRR